MKQQTEKQWRRMMRVEAIITEQLNNHEEAVERGYEWDRASRFRGKPHILPDHVYWLLVEEHRTLNCTGSAS